MDKPVKPKRNFAKLDGSHPIWSLIRLVIIMISLCVILYLEADSFDGTELRSILWMFLAAASAEGAIHAGARAFRDKNNG